MNDCFHGTLHWQNVTVVVDKNNIILNNVSGKAATGTITALMGHSGSGKTTLLGAIAQKLPETKGNIHLNGVKIIPDLMKNISCFLYQKDIYPECLTALEYLEFMCALKLGSERTSKQRKLIVKKTIIDYGLDACRDCLMSNLSGGERKRVFLVSELMTDPLIIFCDEPTTGLDSHNALRVVQTLKEISCRGKIVLLSVHQPSSEIYNIFSHLMLMSNGNLVFGGRTEDAHDFFNRFGMICPVSYNPADFYIKQLINWPPDQTLPLDNNCEDNYAFFKEDKDTIKDSLNIYKRKPCPLHIQFQWLLWKSTKETIRRNGTNMTNILVLMVTATIISSFYSSYQSTSANYIQDTSGLLYLTVSEILFTQTYIVLYVFVEDFIIFLREKDLYSITIYYGIKLLLLVPQMVILPSAFLTLVFLIVRLPGGFISFLKMDAVLMIGSFTATSYGLMLSALFESPDYINLILVTLDMVFLLMSGIFVNTNSMPFVLSWLKYVSHFFYSYEALNILYWLPSSGTAPYGTAPNGTAPYGTAPNGTAPYGAALNVTASNSTEVLTQIGLDESSFAFDVSAMVAAGVLMNLVGYLGIVRKKRRHSPL